jgi:hypothetical protein
VARRVWDKFTKCVRRVWPTASCAERLASAELRRQFSALARRLERDYNTVEMVITPASWRKSQVVGLAENMISIYRLHACKR